MLQESARSISSDRETGYGLLDYAYAEKIAKDVKVSEIVTGAAVSGENRTKLKEYEIPAIVEANWSGKEQRNTEKVSSDNDHAYLIQRCQYYGWVNYSDVELTIMKNACIFPDDTRKYSSSEGKLIPHDAEVMNAGQYSYDNKQMTNYVAAARCLYNCAWRINRGIDCSVSQMMNYCDNHYNSDILTVEKLGIDRKNLKWMVNYAMTKVLPNNENLGGLTSRMQQLQLIGLAIHVASDAYAHQGLVPARDYKSIKEAVSGYGVGEFRGKKLEDKLKTGIYTTKMVAHHVNTDISIAHGLICDNPEFENERYYMGSAWAVIKMLQYFSQPIPAKFDPYVFTVDLVDSNYTYKYGIYNLKGNVISAGYSLADYPLISVARWDRLSKLTDTK